MADLNSMMEEERTRLQKLLEDIWQKRVALDQEEAAVNVELDALTAYFDTKLGKVTARQVKNTPKERKPRGPRGESVKSVVLATIKEHGGPISKQDIIESMNASSNKSLQNGISNALVLLKKAGTIASLDRGTYTMAPFAVPEKKIRRVPKDESAGT